MLNIENIRNDFPILAREVHGKPLVYFDNGATTQKPQAVLDRIMHAYTLENSNIHRGVHYLSGVATEAHEAARQRVADFIGAESKDEILFTRGTTESINLVARTLADQICHEGDEILISTMEHHSNIVPWQMACERTGAVLRVAPINEKGELILSEFEALLNERTKIVSIAHVSNVLGTVNPVADIIRMAHNHGAKVLIDGAQAIAHIPVNVVDLDADFYAFSGHKVYAPNGIGVLYGKRALLDSMPPFMGGGEMIETVRFEKTTYNKLPYKYEAGTPDYVGSCALAIALDYISTIGMQSIADYEHHLLHYATQKIKEIDGVRIIGEAQEKSGVLSFVVDGVHPYDIGMMLDKLGIAIRTGHHCAEPLIDHFGIPGTARASFAFYNTIEEIDYFIASLKRVLMILR
ncbi:MAG: cysteine desulfurase [Paludibacteraceae bacterium]|nr:cysteine desulfurase [Paludibacteraceae bacterium]